MGRVVYKVVVNPNEAHPKPAVVAKKNGDPMWKAAYFDGPSLRLTECLVSDGTLEQMKVLGTWELSHG